MYKFVFPSEVYVTSFTLARHVQMCVFKEKNLTFQQQKKIEKRCVKCAAVVTHVRFYYRKTLVFQGQQEIRWIKNI